MGIFTEFKLSCILYEVYFERQLLVHFTPATVLSSAVLSISITVIIFNPVYQVITVQAFEG